jgi:hypothetical protein
MGMAELAPIKIENKSVQIPLEYFDDSEELELIVADGFAHVRPKHAAHLQSRVAGTAIGQITILPGFDEPWPDEFLDLFEK